MSNGLVSGIIVNNIFIETFQREGKAGGRENCDGDH